MYSFATLDQIAPLWNFYMHRSWAALGRTQGNETIYEMPKVLVKADEEQVQPGTM